MKALPTLIFIVVLFISSALTAQTKLPRAYDPGFLNDGRYLQQPLKTTKQLMSTDSLTRSEIQSRLNTILPKNDRNGSGKEADLLRIPKGIPANPKDFMDLNGNQVYRLKSSLSLMSY